MPKKIDGEQVATTEELPTEKPAAAPPRTTMTNWMAFARAKLAPKRFRLWRYPGYFAYDGSSHTTLIPSSENIINNVERAHTAGDELGVDFLLVPVRQIWPGWAKLQEAGIEIKDLTCGVCQRKLPINPGHLLQHMKRHKNPAISKAQLGGRFLIALGKEGRVVTEEEAFLEDLPDVWLESEVG